MLTPDELYDLVQNSTVRKLFLQVEEDVLQDIARRISKSPLGVMTSTADWQAYRLEQTRLFKSSIIQKLARLTGRSQNAIRDMLLQAGTETLLRDDAIYRAVGKDTPPLNASPALLNILNAGARQTAGTFQNLTETTANTATRQFEDALDRAWMQVSSGAFDYKTAVQRAVADLADKGLHAIIYPTGWVDTLEVAVRRAVLTGVNQTCAKLQIERMDEMHCEFVEVTAHAGARPEHAVWQGKVYHRGGAIWYQGVYYPDFDSSTEYGSGRGLCGWNCRHNFFPFFPSLSRRNYTDSQLKALDAPEIEYNGKKYTRYEISQMQRGMERKVRKYKRKYLCEEAAGLDSTKSAMKLAESRKDLKEFARKTGDRIDSARTGVNGFGRSAVGKAAWSVRKTEKS